MTFETNEVCMDHTLKEALRGVYASEFREAVAADDVDRIKEILVEICETLEIMSEMTRAQAGVLAGAGDRLRSVLAGGEVSLEEVLG